MPESYFLEPIARVRSTRTEATDDGWESETAYIDLDTDILPPEACRGLDTFSHIEVIYLFHRADPAVVTRGARHPRGRSDWPSVGILAQRAKDRPNRLGATCCQLLSVRGTSLEVRGLDAIDGTPVLDIKPVFSGFLPRGPLREPDWAREIMNDYW